MELFPGGPVELPTSVTFGDHVVTVDMGVLQAVHAISLRDWRAIIPDGLVARDRAAITNRLNDRRDPLTYWHIDAAAIQLSVRLCGIDTEIKGYRAAVKICATIIQAWPNVSGLLATNGIDVSRDPLWRTSAAIYRLYIEPPEAKNEDKISQRNTFFLPLPGEPRELFAEAGKRINVTTVSESAAAWQENKKIYDAINARTRT